jgi:DNA-binding GntR family transcriptional regulator
MRRGRLAEYAYAYTKRKLFDGTLPPGAKLRVEDVVASLHTSRQPVMDAFKRLAAEGYLEITPQVGCRVVVPDAGEIADFFLILGAVAGLAADLSAERATPAEVRELESIADAIDELDAGEPATAEIASYRRLDHDFHERIRAMAHSEAIAHLAANLLDRRDFYVMCIPDGEREYVQRMHGARGEHRAVAQAIARGDAEAARSRTEALVSTLGRFATPSTAVSRS